MVRFDELYEVSDLHMGGGPGFQIFNQGQTLAQLIDFVRERPPERLVALVLNGDIVDFLAETGAGYFSPESAVLMLERIFRDPAFHPIWKALAQLVRVPHRSLVFVLGNHDVELALPEVQERLLHELCGEDEAARGRVYTTMDGTGFRCQVGRAIVLCLHGNEADPWNVVDYDALRRLVQHQRYGLATPEWSPNAGTELVIDVMNPIKLDHPFVDLLKPETDLLPRVLLALEPGVLARLKHFGSIGYRLARGKAKIDGYLTGTPQDDAEVQRFTRDMLLNPVGLEVGSLPNPEALLSQVDEDFRAGLSPRSLGQLDPEATLGLPQYMWDRLVLHRSPAEALRTALKDWKRDGGTFDPGSPDKTFEQLSAAIGASIDFLVAGHTHLARALERPHGLGFYFNSGTWIRLIRLTDAMLASAESFAPVYKALTARSMAALDQAPGLILHRLSVVSIIAGPEGTIGELSQVNPGHGQMTLVSGPGCRFVR